MVAEIFKDINNKTKKQMKNITLLLAIIFATNAIAQQEEYNPNTLLGGGDHSVRGFVGFSSKGLQLNNQIAVLSGAEINLVFGHKVNLGFFGYGKINEVQSNFVDNQGFLNHYELGLGGFKIEPVLFTNSMVHLTIPVQMGAGALSLNRNRLMNFDYYNNGDWENSLYDFDAFIFIEPSISAELNLLKHLRLNAGVGYMLTDKVNLAGTNAFPLEGFTANISLRIGWF